MSTRYAVIRGEELHEPGGREDVEPAGTGRYLLQRLAAGAPAGSFEGEVITRWADVIEASPRLVRHAAEAFATWARGLRREEAAELFERAVLCAVVELEWPTRRRADRRGGAPS
ncbi:hypothetical protein WME90_01835 [Sorangium sp. So ce375]|uniref:hypothetical protein n=1 Tax=Sorangium sp. So ce375 TaxID=3133306 RepID=UPI003F5BA5F3